MAYVGLTEIVKRIGELEIRGNVIPQAWLQHLRYPSGRPYLTAVILLSEIVYWYKPTEIRDEATGRVIELRRKFKADKLQRTYQSFADQFGLSKREARDALHYLKDKGIITIELRNIKTASGLQLFQVVFLEPVPDMLVKIMEPISSPESEPAYVETEGGIRHNVGGGTPECRTCTITTTETTTPYSACVEKSKPTVTSTIPSKRPVVAMSASLPAGAQEPGLLIEEDSAAPVGAKIDDSQAVIPPGFEDLLPDDGSTHIDPRQPKPRSAEDAVQETIRSAMAYNTRTMSWGAGSAILNKRMQRVKNHGPVTWVGIALSSVGLEPVWSSKIGVSYWVDKIEELLEIAHGDEQLVSHAITNAVQDNRARGYPITYNGPQSFQGAVHKEMMMLTAGTQEKEPQVPRITADEWMEK